MLWLYHVAGLPRHWVVVVVEVMVVDHGIGLLVIAAVSCCRPTTSPGGGGSEGDGGGVSSK